MLDVSPRRVRQMVATGVIPRGTRRYIYGDFFERWLSMKAIARLYGMSTKEVEHELRRRIHQVKKRRRATVHRRRRVRMGKNRNAR